MQSMDTNCYDQTIAALQRYCNLQSTIHKNTVERAILKLEQHKMMASVEENLNNCASKIFHKMMLSDREKGTFMRITTEQLFEVIKTKENQVFIRLEENLFSLEAKSGIYFFTMKYDVPESFVTVMRKHSKGQRKMDVYSFMFNRFPQLTSDSEEDDLKIIRKTMVQMFKKLSRAWKYLQEPKTPSNITSTPSSLSAEDEIQIESVI